jgi:hypothetical protein
MLVLLADGGTARRVADKPVVAAGRVSGAGLTEAAARRSGHHVRAVEYDLGVSGACVRELATAAG